MQSKHGISIDVLNANTPGRIPLSVLLEGGITLVRVPHGPFKVRVITPHPTDVTLTLDEKQLAVHKVQAGMTELAMTGDGRALTFQAPSPVQDQPVAESEPAVIVTDGFSDSVPVEVLAQTVRDGIVGGADQPALRHQPQHVSGFLVVSLKFTEQPVVPGIVPPPYDTDELAFQMNPPADHNRAVAANFHKIVPPEKIERRWCSCCRQFDNR